MTLIQTGIKLAMDLKHIGVVIPAYNGEKTIGKLLSELIDYGFDKDNIIVVDDGSKDDTPQIAKSYGARVIRNEKNVGKGWALSLGFNIARADNLKKVFTLDADGQHKPSHVYSFLKFKDHYDLVLGVRCLNSSPMPILRRLVNRTTSLVISLLSKRYIPDVQSGYRLIDLKIFDKVNLKTKNFQTESELVYKTIRHNYQVGFVPITAVYNSEKSYIEPMLDTVRFINMAVRFLWR